MKKSEIVTISGIVTQQNIEHFYTVGRTKAHEIWLKLLASCKKGDDYIPTKNDFAAFVDMDILQANFYLIATKKDVIDMYAYMMELKMRNVKEIKINTPSAQNAEPTEMEKEVERMLKQLELANKGIKRKIKK